MRRCSNQAKQAGAPHGCSFWGAGRAAGIISALLLAGCSTAPPAPVRVEVPVMVPCIGEVPVLPVYEFDQLPTSATDGGIILALARDWTRGRKYEGELMAIIEGCLVVQPSVQVLDLPLLPTPVAPKEAMRPIPPEGYFLRR